MLRSALETEPYPSADKIDDDWLIVLREPYLSSGEGSYHAPMEKGRLIRLSGSGILTLSPGDAVHFEQVSMRIDRGGDRTGVPLEQAILSAIIQLHLDRYERSIRMLDRNLMLLEERRSRTGPRRFLLCIYRERRLANRLVTDLFHIRAVIAAITSDEGRMQALSRRRTDLFGAISHRIEFLHETASNIREGFSSLIDLHINDQSYEMNSVMKVIALITAITLVPTLVGQMLGMNLLDSPWPYYLWQILIITLAVMLAIAYLFRQLGWMR
ncbi:MAG: hypothetical protein EHJ95_06185 [Methanobacteriota archaeon]|nr:MAG: hypothetical protein EHJ95_06185 [Euryarchaeota archaeon]